MFPEHRYASLESPDIRHRAQEDPRGFLASFRRSCIIDEVQGVPELLSYLQEILDNKKDDRQFILTGSNSLQLSERISQSLAGRVRLLTLLPLLRTELPAPQRPAFLDETLWCGSYPRVFDEDLDPADWYSDYYNTYVQKDVRSMLGIQNLGQFDTFMRLCAGRSGQLLNLASLASDAGISQPTATRWLGLLEASFLVFRLRPHHQNFNKRVSKAPKLYFYDTGLLTYLLRVSKAHQLESHPLRGSLFETWVVSETVKHFTARGVEPPLYFWRDQHGHEIDLLIDRGIELFPVEIKSGTTFQSSWSRMLEWFAKLSAGPHGAVVYGGQEDFNHNRVQVSCWRQLETLIGRT